MYSPLLLGGRRLSAANLREGEGRRRFVRIAMRQMTARAPKAKPRTNPALTDPDASSATSDRLLSAAASLFRQKGYSASTTREIAALLGINKASLYHHIKGK